MREEYWAALLAVGIFSSLVVGYNSGERAGFNRAREEIKNATTNLQARVAPTNLDSGIIQQLNLLYQVN